VRTKEFASIGRQLAANLDGFVSWRDLLILTPVRHVLRAICFDRSIDSRSFYLEAFFQPLYVPKDYMAFTLGRRLRRKGRQSWDADAPELVEDTLAAFRSQALPFLGAKTDGDNKVNRMVLKEAWGSPNQNACEAAAYTLVRMGRIPEAVETIDKLLEMLRDTVPWHQEMRKRVTLVKADLDKGLDAAMERLNGWEAETIRNLKLEPFIER